MKHNFKRKTVQVANDSTYFKEYRVRRLWEEYYELFSKPNMKVVADKIGINQSTLYLFNTGKRIPAQKTLTKIGRFCQTELSNYKIGEKELEKRYKALEEK